MHRRVIGSTSSQFGRQALAQRIRKLKHWIMTLNKSFNKKHFWAYIWLALGLLLLALEIHSFSGHIGSDYRIFYKAAIRFRTNASSLYVLDSARTLQGFLYPPPAVILFLPFSIFPMDLSYRLFLALLYSSAFAAMAIWANLSDFNDKAVAISRLSRTNLVLLSTVSGPFFAAITAGQVDILVLLLCVAYIALIVQDRPVIGGLVLAIGFWIKLYPVVLLAYVLSRRDAFQILLGFAFGLLIVPLVLAPAVPFELYRLYFLDLLPRFSGSTIVNIYNQSLAAFYTRLNLPLSAGIHSFQVYAVPTSVRLPIAAGAIAIAASISVVTKFVKPATLPLLAMILAIFAVFAPLGWGHTYVYIFPLVYSTWIMGRQAQSTFTPIFVGIIYLTLLIPAYRVLPFNPILPELIYKIIYSRYLFSTAFLLLISAMLVRVTNHHKKTTSDLR
jgi:hypothetical protein